MISQKIHKFSISPKSLSINTTNIYKSMGYNEKPDQMVRDDTEYLLQESLSQMKIKCGCNFIPSSCCTVKNNHFLIGKQQFNCGKIIANHLKNADQIIVFLATLGIKFDQYCKSFFNNNNDYKGYIVDNIGHIAIETAVDWMADRLAKKLAVDNIKITNRFSPGYCTWDVSEQQKLFAHLPNFFLDVKLLPSSLMMPMKSISGVFGIGTSVQKKPYDCDTCRQLNCIMKQE